MIDPMNKDQRLSLALLEAARTNSKVIKVLNLLRNRVAENDKEIQEALDQLLDQQEQQLKALEDFIRG